MKGRIRTDTPKRTTTTSWESVALHCCPASQSVSRWMGQIRTRVVAPNCIFKSLPLARSLGMHSFSPFISFFATLPNHTRPLQKRSIECIVAAEPICDVLTASLHLLEQKSRQREIQVTVQISRAAAAAVTKRTRPRVLQGFAHYSGNVLMYVFVSCPQVISIHPVGTPIQRTHPLEWQRHLFMMDGVSRD